MAKKKSIFSMFPNYVSPLGDWESVEKKQEQDNQKIYFVDAEQTSVLISGKCNLKITITLSGFTNQYVKVLIGDNIHSAFSKMDDINKMNIYYADVFAEISVVFLSKEIPITVQLINYANKITDTKTINFIVGKAESKKTDSTNKITFEELKLIFTTADDKVIKEVVDAFNEGVDYFKIDSCLRKAHFFAQALKEVGSGFYIKKPESLNYPSEALKNGFWHSKGKDWVKGDKHNKTPGYYKKGTHKSTINFAYTKKHPEIADLYGRKDLNRYNDNGIQSANSEMLANYVYGNRKDLGNGSPESGDGSKYRGKGLIQLTGRTNYENVDKELKKFDKELDIIESPDDILLDVRLAVLSAMAYWKINKINAVIDKDKTDAVVNKVTNIVNSLEDKDGKAIRVENYRTKTKIVFKVDECNL